MSETTIDVATYDQLFEIAKKYEIAPVQISTDPSYDKLIQYLDKNTGLSLTGLPEFQLMLGKLMEYPAI
ncbi:MAG: hypothetical protein HKN87_22985 [Saprospiraceae bacterium]|nr:hypothetical protein [Saprospiraceae bacterium]